MFTQPRIKEDGHLIEAAVKGCLWSIKGVSTWGNNKFVSRRAVLNMKRHNRRNEVVKHLSYDGWTLKDAPIQLLLDMYWGIDAPILWRGHYFGVDITLRGDKDTLTKKQSVLSMSGYMDSAPITEVDATAIWVVDPDNLPSAARIKDTLRAMSRQRLFVETYYL